VIDVGRIEALRESLRALGLPDSEVSHQLELVMKDAALAGDGGRQAAVANQIVLRQGGSGE
jgi:hypothetical protein